MASEKPAERVCTQRSIPLTTIAAATAVYVLVGWDLKVFENLIGEARESPFLGRFRG